jgi:hypothetical protein
VKPKDKSEIGKAESRNLKPNAGPMKYGAGFHGLKKLKTEKLPGEGLIQKLPGGIWNGFHGPKDFTGPRPVQ